MKYNAYDMHMQLSQNKINTVLILLLRNQTVELLRKSLNYLCY